MPTKHVSGTSGAAFQVDVTNSGPQVKNESGTLAVRNDADSAYLKLKAADGTAADEAASKGQMDTATTDIANSSLADMAAYTLKLRNAGTTGAPGDVKVSALTEETAPAASDWVLMEESGGNLRKVDAGDLVNVFGLDYTRATSRGESNTTSGYGVVKLTHTTAALTGVYRVHWQAQVRHSSNSNRVHVAGENTTDTVTIGSNAVTIMEPKDGANWFWMSSSQDFTFTGAVKTFEIQYGRGGTSGLSWIRGAAITYWRVSD